jgi:bacteriocin biosynthesis cyclodehydratase domain-containing protein
MHPVVVRRPALKPALRRVWRDATTLQVGLDPRRAIVLSGVSSSTARLIDQIDGTHDVEGLRASASRMGLGPDVADRLVAMLAGASVLDDAASDPAPLAALTLPERERLAPDLAAASLAVAGSAADAGLSMLSHRQAARVAVIGAGRVGTATAALLAAAGVGHVAVEDPVIAGQADRIPGGIDEAGVGTPRERATRDAVQRSSSSTRTTHLLPGTAHLVILASSGAPDTDRIDALVRAGTPHLLVTIREVTGIVGPFVFPGTSACRRCLDLHRRDRDPGWPLIAAQLATEGRGSRAVACDVVLASQVASICVAQALQFVDGLGQPATRNGTLEVRHPDWQVRRRSWPPHPGCGCHWPATDPSVAASAGSPIREHRLPPTQAARSSRTMDL